jgi:hypothetical protein
MTGTAPRWNRNSWTPLYRPDGAEWLEGAVEEVEALCREHGWRLDTARNQEGVSFKCSNRIRFRVEVPRGARKAHVLDDGQPFPQTLATWRYVKSYSAGQLNWVVYASSAPHARVADLVEVLTPVCR